VQAEAYVTLAARHETALYAYAARMLGGARDGERCLVAALTAGWHELDGGAEPARPQEWFTGLVRERCFDELAQRAPAGPEDDLTDGDCVALAANAALAALRPAYRDLLLLRDVHGFDTGLLCTLTDTSEADVENQLYRARAEFASAYAAQKAPERCPVRRSDCPACAERERLRALPQHALLHLGPLPVRDRVRAAVRSAVSGA
jgi:DNA-directed RNA polymerase specialized sigma24 family protein